MKWIKWILGIVLAGVATLWPANLIMHHSGKVDMDNLTVFQYWVQFLAVPSLAFGLFVFLSCLLVPFFKKYAGVLVFSLSIIFIALGVWQHYTDDGVLRNQYIVRYTGFITCMIAGFILSYKMFVKDKWTT
jgi:uncharacterized paraquat-inducible protein A